jgi:23S rRNA (guanosine2251-2'-O)-methyltransferase
MDKSSREDLIAGLHSVLAALEAGRPLHRILLQTGRRGEGPARIRGLGRELGIPVQEVDKKVLDSLAGKAHQGVVAVAALSSYASVEDVLAKARTGGEDPLLLVLDGVQDPRNLGALARTADAAGVHGVILGKHRSAGLTAAAAKAAAGALEHLPVARVTNVPRTLAELKEQGIWVVGLDAGGEKELWQTDLRGPLAVVMGSEGKGLGRLVREGCDFSLRLPMRGRIPSLNVAAAGAVVLYEVFRQRHGPERL